MENNSNAEQTEQRKRPFTHSFCCGCARIWRTTHRQGISLLYNRLYLPNPHPRVASQFLLPTRSSASESTIAVMAAYSSTTGSAIKNNKTIQTEEEQQHALQMGWGVLFTFTTKKHLPVMLGAILTAAVSAATLPVFSIIYGLIFNSYADYGAGNTDGDELLRDVTRYCLILTGVATANWIMNSTSFFFMLIFGELQAKSARTRVFDVLVRKDITWFDLRESGIAAFLPTIQS
jgi:hypothetical protein